MFTSDMRLDDKLRWKTLTGHHDRDRNQRTGDVQRESSAVEDERIKNDPERFPAANYAE